ncbi:MAG: hypothetical protein JWN46_638 [Acidimicrobiales bacterium]|nr:hypothetical protein [Acidimicrobiales bacterium]
MVAGRSSAGDRPLIEEADQVRARHVQEVSSFLRRQLGVHRQDCDGVALCELVDHTSEELSHRRGKVDGFAIGHDAGWVRSPGWSLERGANLLDERGLISGRRHGLRMRGRCRASHVPSVARNRKSRNGPGRAHGALPWAFARQFGGSTLGHCAAFSNAALMCWSCARRVQASSAAPGAGVAIEPPTRRDDPCPGPGGTVVSATWDVPLVRWSIGRRRCAPSKSWRLRRRSSDPLGHRAFGPIGWILFRPQGGRRVRMAAAPDWLMPRGWFG